MPGRHDVGDLGVERNPVQRRMSLDEAPVPLLAKLGVHEVMGHDHVVQPRREVPEWLRQLGRLQDQQRADHLHPGRPALAAGADHDVARPKPKAAPPATVLTRRLIVERDTGHARERSRDASQSCSASRAAQTWLAILGESPERQPAIVTHVTSVPEAGKGLARHPSGANMGGSPVALGPAVVAYSEIYAPGLTHRSGKMHT